MCRYLCSSSVCLRHQAKGVKFPWLQEIKVYFQTQSPSHDRHADLGLTGQCAWKRKYGSIAHSQWVKKTTLWFFRCRISFCFCHKEILCEIHGWRLWHHPAQPYKPERGSWIGKAQNNQLITHKDQNNHNGLFYSSLSLFSPRLDEMRSLLRSPFSHNPCMVSSCVWRLSTHTAACRTTGCSSFPTCHYSKSCCVRLSNVPMSASPVSDEQRVLHGNKARAGFQLNTVWHQNVGKRGC